MKPKIGILNSGGDCAGLNAVIASIVKSGSDEYDFIGIDKGLEGLVEEGTDRPLTREDVRGIAHVGGTILFTTNKGVMGGKNKDGQVKQLDPENVAKAQDKFAQLGLHALIVIGGDGSLTSAMQLADSGLNIVGVPKTIDNDLKATYRTFGFESAVEIVTESLDRIHTTARSHRRIMIVEVMGRHAGWIGLHGGIAGNADAILIPEIPFSYRRVVELVKRRAESGRDETIIVVSEGAISQDEPGPVYMEQNMQETEGEYRLGGVAEKISAHLSLELPEYENRCLTLGHVQRGGSPTSDDRILGFMYGAQALRLVKEGKFGHMVSWDGNSLDSVPLAQAVEDLNTIDPDYFLVKMARDVGISFGD